jgi:nicotinamidase-related amidase
MATTPDRALVVIDVQNEYVTGGLRIEYPGLDVSLPNIARAMDGAYRAGIPVVVVQNRAPRTSPLFAEGSEGWKLHDSVAGRPRAHLVEKTLPSAFAGTDLAGWIASRGIKTLALCGYMTHNCVASTAIQALHDGLAVEVLSDATGSVPYANAAGAASAQEIHQAFSVVLQSRFAAVMPTDAWLEAIAGGKAPVRENIFTSHRNALEAARPSLTATSGIRRGPRTATR